MVRVQRKWEVADKMDDAVAGDHVIWDRGAGRNLGRVRSHDRRDSSKHDALLLEYDIDTPIVTSSRANT